LPGVIETVTAVNEVGAISGIEPQREILFGEMFGTSNAFDRPGGSFDLGSWMADILLFLFNQGFNLG
jgi:hypothetical protein